MPYSLGWIDISVRLGLAIVAGTLIGLDRGKHGRPAGLRTTLLVCLASALSMIQANLLLGTAGRAADSFVTLDLMRLPLGILTGMGFIGAGAILRKGDAVLGVTTAATLWFVTVIGLCFGGGQLSLGTAALVLGLVVLKGMKHLETLLPQDRRAMLAVTGRLGRMTEGDVYSELLQHGFRVESTGMRYDKDANEFTLHCEVQWQWRPTDPPLPHLVTELSRREGISRLEWNSLGQPSPHLD